MKRTWVVLFCTCFFAGCGGGKEETANSKPSSTVDSTPQFSVTDDVEPMTDEATKFAEQLEELSAKANEHQIAFQFAAAAKTWNQVESLLTKQFGADSWQATNARIAAQTAQIESEFSEDQIALLRTVFEKQNQVGEALRESDMKTALKLSGESTQLTRQLFGVESFMMGKQLMQLARMNQQMGMIDNATTQYHQAVSLLLNFLGESHPDLELGHAYLGEIYLAKNNNTQAISHLIEATSISRELWGEGSLRYAARANDLGVAYYRNRDFESATKILRAAESIRRGRLSASHPQVAHSLSNLGIVYLDMERNELAEQCLEQSHEIFVQHYGNQNRLTGDIKSKLATAKMLVNKPAEAERLLTELINSVQDVSHPRTTAALQYRLGIALSRQGKYSTAEPLFRSALETQRGHLGEGHSATIQTMQAYALLLKQSNRTADAELMNQRIQRVAQQTTDNTFRR